MRLDRARQRVSVADREAAVHPVRVPPGGQSRPALANFTLPLFVPRSNGAGACLNAQSPDPVRALHLLLMHRPWDPEVRWGNQARTPHRLRLESHRPDLTECSGTIALRGARQMPVLRGRSRTSVIPRYWPNAVPKTPSTRAPAGLGQAPTGTDTTVQYSSTGHSSGDEVESR